MRITSFPFGLSSNSRDARPVRTVSPSTKRSSDFTGDELKPRALCIAAVCVGHANREAQLPKTRTTRIRRRIRKRCLSQNQLSEDTREKIPAIDETILLLLFCFFSFVSSCND